MAACSFELHILLWSLRRNSQGGVRETCLLGNLLQFVRNPAPRLKYLELRHLHSWLCCLYLYMLWRQTLHQIAWCLESLATLDFLICQFRHVQEGLK